MRANKPILPTDHDRLVEKLRQLQLTETADNLTALLSEASRSKWSSLQLLDQICNRELEAKHSKRVRMGLQISRFPFVRTLEEFQFQAQPTLEESRVLDLTTGGFVAEKENVLLIGPPGVGKTHLAVALGRKMAELGYSVLYTEVTALLAALHKAESTGRLAEKLTQYSKPKLLIVDEVGYLPFEQRMAHLFFQLVNRRYNKGSMIITTNKRVNEWGQVFGDEVLAMAILDRVLHHSHAFMIMGDSYRLKEKKRSELFGAKEEPQPQTAKAQGKARGKTR